MRISSKGQVTIPQEIREQLGLLPDTEVEFVLEGDSVRLRKVEPRKGPSRGQLAVGRLRGRARAVALTTDQLMALTPDLK
jgi:AbrB family looped-hinge helix DNA binding protein